MLRLELFILFSKVCRLCSNLWAFSLIFRMSVCFWLMILSWAGNFSLWGIFCLYICCCFFLTSSSFLGFLNRSAFLCEENRLTSPINPRRFVVWTFFLSDFSYGFVLPCADVLKIDTLSLLLEFMLTTARCRLLLICSDGNGALMLILIISFSLFPETI